MTCSHSDPHDEMKAAEARVGEAMARIPHKILVMSGKGGVGKTTVAVNLAFALAKQGLQVGVLDVDLHGPNAALMAGVEGRHTDILDEKIRMVDAGNGVRLLSISFFLEDPDAPIVWRGPRKTGAIRQLLADGNWEGIEVLVVDCPPGTGDEPMSVAQLIPDADGSIVVTSPQDVALLDSRKCVHFVGQIGQRMLGIIENMSGFICPSCGDRIDLFKTGGGERAATELHVPFLGRIPISAAMVDAGDSGRPIVLHHPEDPASLALTEIARGLQAGWDAPTAKDLPKGTQTMTAKRTVAVASDNDQDLKGEVSMHFGRCPFFTLVEVEDGAIRDSRVVPNPHYDNHQPGIMPGFIHSLGAHVILAGGMGPKAVQLFHGFGMDVATGAIGQVDKVVQAYLAGQLSGIVPCHHDHPESCGHHGD